MTRLSLLNSIEAHEGYRAAPYQDSLALWTLGIGRCVETNPLTRTEWKRLLDSGDLTVAITHEGAMQLVEVEVDKIIRELSSELDFWPALPDGVQEILIEMAFQMGAGSLLAFHRMLAAIKRHDYEAAAKEGLASKWAKQTPGRAKEMMERLEKL